MVALLVAAVAIGHVFERFVMENLDQRLDAQLVVVARAVRADGSLDPNAAVDVPPFDRPGSGWAWQVIAPGGTLRSASLGGTNLVALTEQEREHHHHDGLRPRPFEGLGSDGQPVHGRAVLIATAAGPAELMAAGPRRMVERPLRAATTPLLLSIALLGIVLTVAVLIQLRLGLRPLKRLQAMLVEVREGRRDRVEVDEPSELLPLVAELNALLDTNEAQLARARLHVANLAHGLKTPLATLRLDLAEGARDADGRLAAQVCRLEDQIRHHLARARSEEGRAALRSSTPLAPALDGLAVAMHRLHAERTIEAVVDVPDALGVRCDPQDLDEALGNLIDNAWRHARQTVNIRADMEAGHARIEIADDGAALSDAKLAALQDGTMRADERGGGHGQGVRIARELIELHGGRLRFARAASGGLVARIELPAGQR
ncbi:HAMP domain-containing histidine kinase [Sphingomonas nostoxanthinifaciens]|nr:HAMP domain-containing histidine kinase [Sphingomonas nostoxanthinifaciens]